MDSEIAMEIVTKVEHMAEMRALRDEDIESDADAGADIETDLVSGCNSIPIVEFPWNFDPPLCIFQTKSFCTLWPS